MCTVPGNKYSIQYFSFQKINHHTGNHHSWWINTKLVSKNDYEEIFFLKKKCFKIFKKYSIFFRFWEMFNIHLSDPEISENKASHVKRMMINEKFWNQDVKENLIYNKTGSKVGIKMNFTLESNFTITFGSVFLAHKLAMLLWFKFFHLLSFLSHARLYYLIFQGPSNVY